MSLSAVQADIFLHHLEIQSSNPESLANFYSKIMDIKHRKNRELYKILSYTLNF